MILAALTIPGTLWALILAIIVIWLIFFVLPLPPMIRTAFAILVAVGLLFMLFGCATNTGDPKKDTAGRVTNAVASEVFNAVLKAGLQYGTQALTGQNGQDAAASIFQNAAAIDGPAAIQHVLQAYAGPDVKPIADVAAQQFAKANPETPEAKQQVANIIGAALQQVANEKFSK